MANYGSVGKNASFKGSSDPAHYSTDHLYYGNVAHTVDSGVNAQIVLPIVVRLPTQAADPLFSSE